MTEKWFFRTATPSIITKPQDDYSVGYNFCRSLSYLAIYPLSDCSVAAQSGSSVMFATMNGRPARFKSRSTTDLDLRYYPKSNSSSTSGNLTSFTDKVVEHNISGEHQTNLQSLDHKKAKHGRFQKLFSSVPVTEMLVNKFSCAYITERGGLIQGQLYVARNWICFYSNIFGIKKTLEIPLASVVHIKKARTAKIFPNAVGITTKDGRYYMFGSLMSRQNTFKLLMTLLERSRIAANYVVASNAYEFANDLPPLTQSKCDVYVNDDAVREFVDASAGDDLYHSSSICTDEDDDDGDISWTPNNNNNNNNNSVVNNNSAGRHNKRRGRQKTTDAIKNIGFEYSTVAIRGASTKPIVRNVHPSTSSTVAIIVLSVLVAVLLTTLLQLYIFPGRFTSNPLSLRDIEHLSTIIDKSLTSVQQMRSHVEKAVHALSL